MLFDSLYMRYPRIVKCIGSESILVDVRGWGCEEGKGNGELMLNWDRISVQEGEKFRRQIMVRCMHNNVNALYLVPLLSSLFHIMLLLPFISMYDKIHYNKKNKIKNKKIEKKHSSLFILFWSKFHFPCDLQFFLLPADFGLCTCVCVCVYQVVGQIVYQRF